MTEPVAVVLDDQHLLANCLTQQLEESGLFEIGNCHDQLVGRAGTCGGDQPHQVLRWRAEPIDPGAEQAAHRTGQSASPGGRGGQLLDEEGVALRTLMDLIDQLVGGRMAQLCREQLGYLGPIERPQLHLLDTGIAGELGQHSVERVAPVELVVAVAADDGQPCGGPQAVHEPDEHVAGGCVGPVQVLQHHQHRGTVGEALEDAEHLLEERRWRGGLDRRRVAAGQRRDEPGQDVRAGPIMRSRSSSGTILTRSRSAWAMAPRVGPSTPTLIEPPTNTIAPRRRA